MNIQSISGALLRDLFLGGAANLEKNKAYIDSLNVFPVPDGDTGTNMSMTMQGAIKDLRSMPDTVTVGEVMDAVALGALKNARGNSGVILSQLFRGYQQVCKGQREIDVSVLADALETEGFHNVLEIGIILLYDIEGLIVLSELSHEFSWKRI